MATYKGKWTPKNKSKYAGDWSKITYRSLWERNAFRWCDTNDSVIKWNSEEVVIKYFCPTDKRYHRYYVDLLIEFRNGDTVLVEIKPKKETSPPKKPTRKTKRYLNEVTTYIKNTAKWQAAKAFADQHNVKFEIWTEDTLKAKGIKLLKG